MERYRTFKTTMGHKVRVRMTKAEIRERRLMILTITVMPFASVWLLAAAAGMI